MQKQIDEVEFLLKKSPQHRSKAEINLLVQLTSQLPFFKQYMKQDNGLQIQRKCCKHMYCEKFKASEIVFYVDSVGTKFYIILEGSVTVLVRKPNQSDMEAVRILNKGESFGELALLHKQPRLATIQCNTDCTFAVLDKQQFKHILQEEQQKQLDEVKSLYYYFKNIDYFSQIRIFSHLHRTQLKHIYLNSFLYEFEKNQIVIKEGQKADYFILIKSGSFLVKKIMKPNLASVNLFEIGELQVFGFYHLNINLPYEYSLVCNSSKGYAYKINRTSLVERMFEQQGEDLKLHRIELQQLANLRTETDVKAASFYPQYFCKRIKTEVPEEFSQEKVTQPITTAKRNLLLYQNKQKQRMNQIKLQMDIASQKLRKQPTKVPYEVSSHTQSELFLKTHRGYNFLQSGEIQMVQSQQTQRLQQHHQYPINYPKLPKKLMIKTHFPEDYAEKQSCDSPLSTTQTQMRSIIGIKKMVLPTAQNRVKSRTFQSQVSSSPLFKTISCILQQRYSSITSSNHFI
ncbi:unnamed protein product [Paramecium octaurelia]|uniref:Cyclic nucleotide-binding domain-containing protein n=1 Tax=Paramecium octaurelia TaxID=43137 RepID=A0A8S1TXJ5_PAROT|nr:unnamed protein product [Paramecium octaurelia]